MKIKELLRGRQNVELLAAVKMLQNELNISIHGLPKKNGDPRLFSNFLAIRNHSVHSENNGD